MTTYPTARLGLPALGEVLKIGHEMPAGKDWNILTISQDGYRRVTGGAAMRGPHVVHTYNIQAYERDGTPIFWDIPDISQSTPYRGGFLPYPLPDNIPHPATAEPVNQLPWLFGYQYGGVDHRGWMIDVCTFAHEALSWDDRQLQRLDKTSHSQHPDIAHTVDSRERARLALKYSRILTGYLYKTLYDWEQLDPTDTTAYFNWSHRLYAIKWMMGAACGTECVTPHWVLDLALNMDPPAWEDALSEQSQNEGDRRVHIPRIDKSEEVWQPGSISDLNNGTFGIFSTGGNPLRIFEDFLEQFGLAAKRYREEYASREH